MEDLIYYIVIVLGLLAVGGGGGALIAKKRARKRQDGAAPVPPRPVPHESVAPSEPEVHAADVAADETDDKLEEIREREEEIREVPPAADKPDPNVVAWLKGKDKDKR